MPQFEHDWGDEDQYVTYWTRHMPLALHKRLKMLALRRDESMEMVLNKALDRGLTELERVKEEML